MTDKCRRKMLFIPYNINENPRIITDRKVFDACANKDTQIDGFAISPELGLECHTYCYGEPNPHLDKFGVVFPGACLIIKEIYDDKGQGGYVDVPDNLYDQLGPIFEADKKARESYQEKLKALGVESISF